ncbi:MAG: EAL domain-containing protein [Thermodesulfobacteriota bacterium]
MDYSRFDAENTQINVLTLTFPPDLEKEYKNDYYNKSLHHVRIAYFIAIFFYSIFGVLDYFLVPEAKEQLWFIRYALFLPFVLMAFLVSYTPLFRGLMQLLNAMIVILAGLGIIAMIVIAPYPQNYSYYAGLILVFIFGYTFFKLLFVYATLACWLIVVAYEVAAIWLSQTPLPILVNNNFFFLSGNILGMFACYSIDYISRRDFIQAHLLDIEREKVSAINRDLEKIVQERTSQLIQANRELKEEMEERFKAQEALLKSEQLFRSLSENAPDIIATLDLSGAFTYVNPAWERLMLYRPEEVLGKFFVEFVNPDEAKYYVRLFKKIRDDKLTFHDVDGRLIAKDGTLVHFSLAGAPNTDSRGNVTGMVGLFKDITTRQKAEQEVKIQKAYLEQLIENAPEAIVILDNHGHITRVNEEFVRLFGYAPEDASGLPLGQLISSEHGGPSPFDLTAAAVRGEKIQAEEICGRKDGSQVYVSVLGTPIKIEGEQVGFYVIYRDITERKKSEEALRESELKHRTVLEASPDPVAVYDMAGQIIYLNPAFTRVFGWNLNEVAGRRLVTPFDDYWSEIDLLIRKMLYGETLSGMETRRSTKNGQIVDVSVSGAVFNSSRGVPEGSIVTFQDITERKRTEEQLKYLAYHDLLTGLPNRKSFYEKIEDLLVQSQRRSRDTLWALLFLDLDRFKDINDTLGHDAGDALLKEVAFRIQNCLRKSDFIFRLGGDEFTVILNHLSKDIDAARVAQIILDSVAQPLSISSQDIYPSASIGISLYPNDGQNVEVLVKNADMAMYAAKDKGNLYRFFTEEMNRKALERVRLENSLRTALQNDQFILYYQPLVDEAHQTIGMEALLRWHHPEMGLISPDRFIPIAEETGTIVPIGEWVLKTACEHIKALQEKGFSRLFVAVNLSPRQFGQPKLVETIDQVLKTTGLDPGCLKIEVTESSVMENPEEAIEKMQRLYDMGIRFSIDDFGTGYSSLSYLKRFPVDTLKIDRSFVRDVTQNLDDQEIVKTIIAMAHSLQMNTVAEGVETEEQKDFLCDQGCKTMQGYLFSRPVPFEDLIEILTKQRVPRQAAK